MVQSSKTERLYNVSSRASEHDLTILSCRYSSLSVVSITAVVNLIVVVCRKRRAELDHSMRWTFGAQTRISHKNARRQSPCTRRHYEIESAQVQSRESIWLCRLEWLCACLMIMNECQSCIQGRINSPDFQHLLRFCLAS